MSRPPHARESVLDAFESILIEDGERAATMEAIARRADVSKGGLLYHFASKDALERALLERASALSIADVADIESAPEGPVAYFLGTAVQTDTPLDRAIVAVARLAQAGRPAASAELRNIRVRWEDALRPHTRDETGLALVMLASDGLYYNNALGAHGAGGVDLPGSDKSPEALADLIALVERTVAAE